MLQYYTLDEAAKILRTTPDKVKEMTRQRKIQALQDGKTWRFKTRDIEELAREMGLGSDPELQLGEAAAPPPRRTGVTPPPKKKSRIDSTEEVSLGEERPDSRGSSKSGRGPRSPKPSSDSDVRLVPDGGLDFPIEDSDIKMADSGKGKTKSRRSSLLPPKPASDSGVRLVPPDQPDSDVKIAPDDQLDSKVPLGASRAKTPSDSDIRLENLPLPTGGRPAGDGLVTEEIDLDAEALRAATSGEKKPKRPRPRSKLNPAPPPSGASLPTSSPFELSEEEFNLDVEEEPENKGTGIDSSSDFELIPIQEDRSPVELGSGEIPLLSDDEVSLGEISTVGAGNSGINLDDPVDSGISLESGGSDEIEFDELSLDIGATPQPGSESQEADSSSDFELTIDDDNLSLDDSVEQEEGSDSEFELTLDDGGLSEEGSDSEFELTLDADGDLSLSEEEEDGKDIFEATNFDVPSLEGESGSEAVALEELEAEEDSSEFELDLDMDGEESGSQAVAVEDEEEVDELAETVARPRKTSAKRAPAAAEFEMEDEDAGFADIDQETEEDVESDVDQPPVTVDAAPAEWGPWPAILLFPAVIVLFLVGLMGFELIQNMWGYNRPGVVAKPLAHTIASMFDDKIPE